MSTYDSSGAGLSPFLPPPGAPAQPPPAPPRPPVPGWARLLILLGIVLVVVVALVAAVVIYRFEHAASAIKRTTIVTPARIGSATLATDPRLTSAAAQAEAGFKNPQVDDSMAAFYVDRDGTPVSLIVAAKYAHPQLARNKSIADDFVLGVSRGAGAAVPHLTSRPAGTLGGTLRCGAVSFGVQRATLCVAADDAALVGMIFYDANTPLSDVQAARGAVERRS